MVHDQNDFFLVKDLLKACFFQLPHGNRACNIIGQGQIDICLNELPRHNGRKARMCSQNFLCHCHSHGKILLQIFLLCFNPASD